MVKKWDKRERKLALGHTLGLRRFPRLQISCPLYNSAEHGGIWNNLAQTITVTRRCAMYNNQALSSRSGSHFEFKTLSSSTHFMSGLTRLNIEGF